MSGTYWRDDAACAGMDTAIFFPISSGDPRVAEATRLSVRVAKAICNECPVIDACLQEAIRLGDVHGIFGGMTGNERSALGKTRKPFACPNPSLSNVVALYAREPYRPSDKKAGEL